MEDKRLCSVDGCNNQKYCKGMCCKHYSRMRAHGSTDVNLSKESAGLDFLKSVISNPPQGCVDWPFTVGENGYGQIRINRRNQKAHRVSLQLHTGESGEGMDAAHGPCHNRQCVNPLHLSWKTRSQNLKDKRRDGTASKLLCEDDVQEILKSKKSSAVLAKDFGCSQSNIRAIRRGETWR